MTSYLPLLAWLSFFHLPFG